MVSGESLTDSMLYFGFFLLWDCFGITFMSRNAFVQYIFMPAMRAVGAYVAVKWTSVMEDVDDGGVCVCVGRHGMGRYGMNTNKYLCYGYVN